MKKTINTILKIIKVKLRIPSELLKIKIIVNAESYYPELTRKSKFRRYMDNIRWVLKYNSVNKYYNLWKMDIKENKEIKKYIEYDTFMRKRNEYNFNIDTPKARYNYIAILRDKNVFEKYMNSLGIMTATTLAVINNGVIYSKNFENIIDEHDLFKDGKQYFIKVINGECADGVFYIKDYNKYLDMKERFSKGIFIIQDKLIQNEIMNKLNPNTINTIRVVTVYNGEEYKILASTTRLGTSANGNVDNWSVGGIAVSVDKNGLLSKYGYYKPGYGTKCIKHPDTGVEFENFQIPYYNDIKNMVIKAHKNLYGIHSIGWDVAITDKGPVLIEGNDNWAINIMQLDKGLKEEWENTLYKRNI